MDCFIKKESTINHYSERPATLSGAGLLYMNYKLQLTSISKITTGIYNKTRQLPAMGNWRDKNTYHSADLGGTIIPIGSHTFPEEGQGFF